MSCRLFLCFYSKKINTPTNTSSANKTRYFSCEINGNACRRFTPYPRCVRSACGQQVSVVVSLYTVHTFGSEPRNNTIAFDRSCRGTLCYRFPRDTTSSSLLGFKESTVCSGRVSLARAHEIKAMLRRRPIAVRSAALASLICFSRFHPASDVPTA